MHYLWRTIIYALRPAILSKFFFSFSYSITLVYCVFCFSLFFIQFVCLYKSKLIIYYWKYSLLLLRINRRMFWKSLETSARINGLIESYLEPQTDALMGIFHLLSVCQWVNKQQSQFLKSTERGIRKPNWTFTRTAVTLRRAISNSAVKCLTQTVHIWEICVSLKSLDNILAGVNLPKYCFWVTWSELWMQFSIETA